MSPASNSLATILILASGWVRLGQADDRIILRSLDVISDQRVVSVGVEGVVLGDQRNIGWDQIERITLDGPLNAQANALLKQLGAPLFRIRQRMTVGDYSGLRDLSKQVTPQFQGQTGPTSLMVSQARMWGCLLEGRREEALLGHFDTCRLLKGNPELAKTLPGKRPIAIEPETGLSADLQPVWFDLETAKRVYPQAIKQAGAIAAPRPAGVYFYCASMALAVGDQAMASRMTAALPADGRSLHWRWLLLAQQETQAGESGPGAQQLAAHWQSMNQVDRPLAWYWLAKNQLATAPATESQNAMLTLLRLVAVYGERHPELAGAALYETMRQLERNDQLPESIRVRRELLDAYSQTYFGRRAVAEEQSETDTTERAVKEAK